MGARPSVCQPARDEVLHETSCQADSPPQAFCSPNLAEPILHRANGMPAHPASKRLRLGRFSEAGRIYLLTTNTRDREPVFSDVALGRLVVAQFRHAQERGCVHSLAWVVMPDHFHWLIELRQGNLGELMQKTKSLASKAVNRAVGRQVRLWQPGFHDRALRCAGTRIWSSWPAMWWPIRCVRGWWGAWATIRCGMRSGFERNERCLYREQARSHRRFVGADTQPPVGASLLAIAAPRCLNPAHTL